MVAWRMGYLLWTLRLLVDQQELRRLDKGPVDLRRSGLHLLDPLAAVVVLVLSAFGWVHAAVATLAWYVGKWIGSLSTRCNLTTAA